jgi:hypothetical protein
LLAGLALLLPIRLAPRLTANDALADPATCYVQEGQRCSWITGKWPHIWQICNENASEEPPMDPEG